MGKRKYPIELKEKVISEYEFRTVGYKILAKKYNLKRDTVREWVLSAKKKAEKEAEKQKLQNQQNQQEENSE